MTGAAGVLAFDSFVLALQLVIVVGDVEGGEDGDAERIDGGGVLGNGAHLGIDKFGEALDVGGVRAAQVVALVVDFDPNTVLVFRHWLFAFFR